MLADASDELHLWVFWNVRSGPGDEESRRGLATDPERDHASGRELMPQADEPAAGEVVDRQVRAGRSLAQPYHDPRAPLTPSTEGRGGGDAIVASVGDLARLHLSLKEPLVSFADEYPSAGKK